MRMPIVSAVALVLLAGGCLFDEEPPCRIGGDACPSGLVCDHARRECVPRGAVGDARPPVDGEPGDMAPEPGDMAPEPGDMAPEPGDAGPDLDAATPDAAPCGRSERCNGLDDDCDGRVDEDLPLCATIDHAVCHWRHRGHQGYLFCDQPEAQAEALDRCSREYGLKMAVPDTCDESEWMWATGNLTPTTVEWVGDDRGRAWWLGLELGIPDNGDTVRRVDGSDGPLPEGCWADGEPDVAIGGESCVDLLYNRATDDFGWNDDICASTPANPINALCETPCDPGIDGDGDGENECVDCDDRDPDANHGDGIDRCALAPEAGFPP